MRRVRGERIAMVMQDPKFSLNPVMTVGSQIGESLTLHTDLTGAAARLQAAAAEYRATDRSAVPPTVHAR